MSEDVHYHLKIVIRSWKENSELSTSHIYFLEQMRKLNKLIEEHLNFTLKPCCQISGWTSLERKGLFIVKRIYFLLFSISLNEHILRLA